MILVAVRDPAGRLVRQLAHCFADLEGASYAARALQARLEAAGLELTACVESPTGWGRKALGP